MNMMLDPDVGHYLAANKYRPQFLAAIGIGLGDLLGAIFAGGAAAAPELGLAAEAGTAAGIGAADVAAASAPLDLLAGGAAAGTADVAGLGTTAALGGGLGADAAGGLSDVAISDLMASPGASAFASTGGGIAAPGITGVGAGSSIGAGAGGLTPDLATSADIAGLGGISPDVASPWMQTPFASDAALTGGNLPAIGAVPPSNVAVGAGGTPGVFGPAPTAFDTGGAAPISFGGVGGGAPPPGATSPGLFDQIGGALAPVGSAIKTAAPALGVAALGYNLYEGYQGQQQLKALQQQETDYQNRIAGAGQAALTAAQPMLATGEALMTGGPIPAPMQAILDNYKNSQRARIIQGYAARDPTNPAAADPKQNSALAQELNAVDNQMLALQESIGNQIVTTANQLLTSGASSTQIAAELPMMMQRLDIALQQQTGNAIANFASAMSGGTMKVSGQGAGSNINLNLTSPNTTTTQSLLGQ